MGMAVAIAQEAPPLLTKSDLQSFLQCPRKLWLEHKRPERIPKGDPTLYRRTTDGNIVGEKARDELGPECLRPTGADNKTQAAVAARALLSRNPGKPAVEVPMQHGGLYARADALVPDGMGYILRETKSATFPLKRDKVTPDAPEDHHVDDVAIQLWAMEQSGIPCTRIELNLLNNRWRYPGGGDYSGLFRTMDVTSEARARRGRVPHWVKNADAVLAAKMPNVVTGPQCKKPYPCCFYDFCLSQDPKGPNDPIELLPDNAGKQLAKKLREGKGYTSLLEPKLEELTGKQANLYRRMQEAHRIGKAVLEPSVAKIMNALPYPRYYFDFEGIDLPVPRWAGVRPYEQIPFQWSCHIERTPGKFEHWEFLDLTGDDPSLACVKKMRQVISPDDGGPIIVYYQTYEEYRLRELAERHPEHKQQMETYLGRLVDLHPIVKDHFYDPRMQGHFSIKDVLPVIAPDLSYSNLRGVQDGTAAQVAYLYAALDQQTLAERKDCLRTELQVYCKQDTWAMVEIAYFLSGRCRPHDNTA